MASFKRFAVNISPPADDPWGMFNIDYEDEWLDFDHFFLCPKAVAHRLGVSAPTVRRWVRLGILPAWKLRSTVRIPADCLLAFLDVARNSARPIPFVPAGRVADRPKKASQE